MNTEIKTALESEILDELNRLAGINLDDDKFKPTVDSIVRLMDKDIEYEKLEAERAEKEANRNLDQELKNKQLEEQQKTRESENFYKDAQLAEERKGRLVTNVISISGLILNIGLVVWGTKKTLKFEETGTITTAAGRNFINKLFRK